MMTLNPAIHCSALAWLRRAFPTRLPSTFAAVLAALCVAGAMLWTPFAAAAQPGDVMTADVVAQRSKTAPGDQFALAVILQFDETWHAWPNKPVLPAGLEDLTAIPTEVKLAKTPALPAGVRVHTQAAQWPEPHEIESAGFTGEPIKVLSLAGRVVVYVPVVIDAGATPGAVSIPLTVSYQACDDSMCMQPTSTEVIATFEIVAATSAIANTSNESDFAGFQPSVFAVLTPGSTPPTESPSGGSTEGVTTSVAPPTTLFGYTLPDPTSAVGIAVLLAGSILGGALMNLTPCVLPVIPIKVMTLTQHAKSHGEHSGKSVSALRLGLWMALGIVAFWTAIGVPMAISAQFDPSRYIFGTWWVTFGIGLIIVAMGLGIMGMFNITLPQSVYKVNPKADSPWGSFVFGIMTAVLGLPCFGFVAGGLLAAAATMPSISVMSVFFGMGVGMAAPFLVLSARPQLLSKMPRTGPASELVKQVMGLMLLAAAAFFIASGLKTLITSKPYIGTTARWWATAFFLALAGVWLVVRTFQITKRPGRRMVFSVVAFLLAFLSIAFAWSETKIERENYVKLRGADTHDDSFVTGAWNHYTTAKFENARASGKLVVADFTADWCLICKTLKRTVLDVDPVKSRLAANDVVMFEIDLTSESAAGWKLLNDLGRTGIPTLAVFMPGEATPAIFNAYTSKTVMDALETATTRSKTTASAGTR